MLKKENACTKIIVVSYDMNKMYWKGRIRKMKKIFKKVVATVAALAFAVAGLVVAPKTAKAVEPTGDTIVVAGKYQGWVNDDTTNVLTKQGDGTYKGIISIPEGMTSTDLQLLVTPGDWAKADAKLDNENAPTLDQNNIGLTGDAGRLELVYNPTTLVLTVTGDVKAQITLDEEYNIFGDLPGLNDSGDIADGVMTENAEGLYEYKVTVPKAKKYRFKIVQDCDGYPWINMYGENGKLTGMNNGSVTVDVDNSEVVITIDPATKDVKVKVTPLSTPAAGEDTTTAAGEDTTPAAGEDTTTAAGENTTTAAGEKTTPAAGNTEKPSDGNVNAGDSMAVAAAVIAAVAACGIVAVSFKKRRQDA